MAVYTEVSFAEADALVQRLGLGALTELQGIGSGIEIGRASCRERV